MAAPTLIFGQPILALPLVSFVVAIHGTERAIVKGDAKVLAVLNEVLKAELTAINQYFLHSEMCEHWGYHRLADETKKESIGEMKHAEIVMERILLLEGTPNMSAYFKINIG